ncbi:oxalate/formate antiporter [Vibrio sp. JCM 19236]|nr:oxalate/formate antiporter [Vibrio sp. JCM 19236]
MCFTLHGGIGGAIGTAVVGFSMANGDGYGLAYTISAVMMGVCVALSLVTRPITEEKAEQLATA